MWHARCWNPGGHEPSPVNRQCLIRARARFRQAVDGEWFMNLGGAHVTNMSQKSIIDIRANSCA